jgi:hypothetical protein
MTEAPKPGHGDHWLAVLDADDPRLADVLATPLDAPEGVRLRRTHLTAAVDMTQVTARRRLVTAYPEPRATALLHLKPHSLSLWSTGVEGWLVVQHEGAGALALFPTDLAEHAVYYQSAGTRKGLDLEVGAIAYMAHRVPHAGEPRLRPAHQVDPRFLPDDYWFEGVVRDVLDAGSGEVLRLGFQNGLELPVAVRAPTGARPGDHVQGVLWLTGRRAGATEK